MPEENRDRAEGIGEVTHAMYEKAQVFGDPQSSAGERHNAKQQMDELRKAEQRRQNAAGNDQHFGRARGRGNGTIRGSQRAETGLNSQDLAERISEDHYEE